MVEQVSYRWSSGRPEDRFEVTDPATGKTVAVVQGGGPAEVDGAVAAANAAFRKDWRWRSGRERGALLQEIARRVRAHDDELARLETLENGKPLAQARGDIEACIAIFNYFGGLAPNLPGEFFDNGPIYGSAVLEPYGVVGAIIPFNWPPMHAAQKIAPALAAGNTLVIKPPEQTPRVVMRIVELANEVLPKDVLHAVPGHGAGAGSALASHPLVRKLSFTGAPATGAAVMRAAAQHHTSTLMELGGKNAMIVLQDADVDATARSLLEAAFFNKGEACTAGSRILVHHSLHDALVERLGAAVSKLRVGPGLEAGVHVGPMVSKRQQQRVLDYIRIGHEEGARTAAIGKIPDAEAYRDGFWVAPMLLKNVTRTMRVAREEIFGPVSCVIAFESVEEAIEIANETEFGLTAAIFTRDHTNAMRIARNLDAGMVFINNYFRGGLFGMPCGGMKASGFGREAAYETLKEYAQTKIITAPSGLAPIPSWQAVADVGLA